MDKALFDEMARIEDRHWWFTGRRRIIADTLKGFALPIGAAICEIGCGTGGNLPMLAKFGTVTGIEGEALARGYAQQRDVATIIAGTLPDDIPLPDHSQDVILLLDVLEHLGDDGAALTTVRRKLRSDGAVVIAVPALALLWSEHDVRHGHLRRYDRTLLAEALRAGGLRQERASYFNFFLFPAMAALRIASRATGGGVSTARALAVPPAPVNAALRQLLIAESALIRHFSLPVGGSLLSVARAA
jgi:SAM-dependent methyltransferase